MSIKTIAVCGTRIIIIRAKSPGSGIGHRYLRKRAKEVKSLSDAAYLYMRARNEIYEVCTGSFVHG